MKVILRIPGWGVEKEIDVSDIEYQRMITNRKEALFDYLVEEMGEAYTEARDGCHTVPQGVFDEDDIRNRVCKHFRDTVEERYRDDIIECDRLDDDGNVVATDTVGVVGVLIATLDSVSGNGEFCACLSEYVDSCLYQFVGQSRWHIERNRIWYGLDGSPEKPWMISADTTQDELGFWFECDPWTIMDHIGNFDEVFLTWYTAECGCYTPDVSEITDKCPIDINKNDTVDSILEKAARWCNYNKCIF